MPQKSSKKSPAKTAAKSATRTMRTVRDATATTTASAAQMHADLSEKTIASMENAMNTNKTHYSKMADDTAATSRQSVGAFMQSGSILAKGTEQLFKTMAEIAQSSTERSTEAFKSLMACKTLNELTETQNRIAQASFDDLMTASTRMSELSIKLATQVFEPINDQMTQTMRKSTASRAA